MSDELTRHGLKLVGQFGSPAIGSTWWPAPAQPGRLVLAIECDGARITPPDRAGPRPAPPAAVGGVRLALPPIWSTDWFLRREEEVRRALKAFADAVDHADGLDNHTVPIAPATVSEPMPSVEAPEGRPRDPRPPVMPGKDIDEYATRAAKPGAVGIVRRTPADRRRDDHRADPGDLGFNRKGSRIVAALSAAIRGVKRQASNGG